MDTNRNQVSYGSSGDDVLQLQKALNNNGYNLAEDGIFGSNTKAAVEDYQSKNGLDVDGIVGVNTWGALDGVSAADKPQASTQTNAPTQPSASGQYAPYTESDTVAQAKALLDQQIASKPGAYQSTWEGQLSDTIAKILNRESFSYDLNSDALYQQYKDRYIQQGKMAMMDTMGQAAAMTGGYGNSYAQSVGQQAYQDHLQQLNDIVPELHNAAYDRYNQEGQDLYNQYAMLSSQEEQDYARYQDGLSAYYADLDRLQNQYNAERDYDYAKYIDDRDFDYQQDRDAVADNQWQQSYDLEVKEWNYSHAMDKLANGITPTSEELTAAGIDSKTADTYVKMATAVESGDSDITPSDWYNINEKCAEYAAGSEGMLREYIAGLYERGWVSEDEANALFDLYFPDTQSPATDTTVDAADPLYGVDMNAVMDAIYNTPLADRSLNALSALLNRNYFK